MDVQCYGKNRFGLMVLFLYIFAAVNFHVICCVMSTVGEAIRSRGNIRLLVIMTARYIVHIPPGLT